MANGILIIDKEADWTSHDVVSKLRGILQERRIGHAGTLDPMATGVLPVFVGRATRAVEYAAEAGKEYVAELTLGLVTDTQDSTGQVLSTHPADLTRRELEDVLPAFRGDILQIPPMYSALKRDGKKLYELARKGIEVAREPRPVTIYELELLAQTGPQRFTLRVACSKGTYIRTLCHDIGVRLGCGGVMSALRRTKAAGFTLAQALPLSAVEKAPDPEALLLPVDTYFSQYPAYTVRDRALALAKNGNPFPCTEGPGHWRVYDPQGRFLLLGRCENNIMSTEKSFFEV